MAKPRSWWRAPASRGAETHLGASNRWKALWTAEAVALDGAAGKVVLVLDEVSPQGELPRRARQGASEVTIACLAHGRQRRGEEASEARPSSRERELREKSEVDGPKLGRVVKRDPTRGRIARVKPRGPAPRRAARRKSGEARCGRRRTKVHAVGSRTIRRVLDIGSGRLQKLDTGIFLEASRRAARRTKTRRGSQAGRSSRVTTVEAAREAGRTGAGVLPRERDREREVLRSIDVKAKVESNPAEGPWARTGVVLKQDGVTAGSGEVERGGRKASRSDERGKELVRRTRRAT